MHCPSRYRHRLPGGRSSSLVGAPSRSRSSFSLLPASVTAGPSDEARAGGADGATSGEAEGVEADGAAGASEGVFRDRVAGGAAALFRFCADVGCDDINRKKSSAMLRVAWQPDISSNPTPTVCVIRPLTVILSSKRVPRSIDTPPRATPGPAWARRRLPLSAGPRGRSPPCRFLHSTEEGHRGREWGKGSSAHFYLPSLWIVDAFA